MIKIQEIKDYAMKNWQRITLIISVIMVVLWLSKCDHKVEKTSAEIKAEKTIKSMDSINKLLVKDTLRWDRERKIFEKKILKSDVVVDKLKSELDKKIVKLQKIKQSDLANSINKRYNFKPEQVTSIDTGNVKFTNNAVRKVAIDLTKLDYVTKELSEQKSKNSYLDTIIDKQDSIHKSLLEQHTNLNTKFQDNKKVVEEKNDKIQVLEKDVRREKSNKTFWKIVSAGAIIAIVASVFGG